MSDEATKAMTRLTGGMKLLVDSGIQPHSIVAKFRYDEEGFLPANFDELCVAAAAMDIEVDIDWYQDPGDEPNTGRIVINLEE